MERWDAGSSAATAVASEGVRETCCEGVARVLEHQSERAPTSECNSAYLSARMASVTTTNDAQVLLRFLIGISVVNGAAALVLAGSLAWYLGQVSKARNAGVDDRAPVLSAALSAAGLVVATAFLLVGAQSPAMLAVAIVAAISASIAAITYMTIVYDYAKRIRARTELRHEPGSVILPSPTLPTRWP